MTPAETILALVGGVGGLGTAASKVWDWYRSRDAAKLAAEAAEAKVRHDREAASRATGASERADIVDLLTRQLAAGESRAETASARAVAMAGSLTDVAAAMRENTAAVAGLGGALASHAEEEFATLREVHAMLRQLTGDGSEVSRTSIIPGVRGPTPPRGIVPLPAVPAPARKGGE